MSALFIGRAVAGNLEISPTSVEVGAPGLASTVTLKNRGDKPVKLQTRLLSWSQTPAGEKLVKTNDVVVSPPFVEIQQNGTAVIRIVRLSKSQVKTEETYRFLVDEIPSRIANKKTTIQMVMRYSLPVFFTDGQHENPTFDMDAQQLNGKLVLNVQNQGAEHLKLFDMRAEGPDGRSVSFGNGLVGYVLAGASNTFAARGKQFPKGSSVIISSNTNLGKITRTVKLR